MDEADTQRSRGTRRRFPRALVALATLAVTVFVVVAIYNLGDGGEEPHPEGTATPGARDLKPDEEQRVTMLIEQLDTDPADVGALIALGDVYFGTGDYEKAGGWMERALAVAPGSARARLALGAAMFNLGDSAGARRQWQRVIELDPENVEARYDLGFLYLGEKPPDFEKTKRLWREVLRLAPGTAVARTVAKHLKGLEKAGAAHSGAGVGAEGS